MEGPDRQRILETCQVSIGQERHNEATLEIASGVVSDEAIRGLLEDWLIPTIVEGLIQERLKAAQPAIPA